MEMKSKRSKTMGCLLLGMETLLNMTPFSYSTTTEKSDRGRTGRQVNGQVNTAEGTCIKGKAMIKESENVLAAEPEKKQNGKLFGSKTKKLKNGLEVVVIEDRGVPRVSIGILYKVGSCDDPENLVGVSHMLEHVFFHGTKKYPKVDKVLGELGGYCNAMTSEDWTMYIEDCPVSALPVVFDLEADRMANFSTEDEEKFQKERKAVFEERLMRLENLPLGLAEEYITNCLSPQHPYGREIIGMRHHIMGYTRQALMDHYHRWYRPNNAVLIVVGDVNATDVFKEAEKAFGAIKPGTIPERVRVQNALTHDLFQEIRYDTDKVETEKVLLRFQAPHFKTDGMKKCFALSIGLDALFDGVVYDFFHYFVEKKAFASEMNCSYEWDGFDPRQVQLDISLMPGVSFEKFYKTFQSQIKAVLSKRISQIEFERAKKAYLMNLTYSIKDGQSRMRMIMTKLSSGCSLDDIEATQSCIESITKEDVDQALKEVFAPGPCALVRFCPKIAKEKK